jgi:hypothetical protein
LSVFQSSLVRFALVRFSICTGPVLHLSDFTKAENSSVFTKAENWSELACPICPILPRLRTRQFLPGLRTCPNLLVLLSDVTKAENSSVFTRAENLSGFPKGENLSVLPKAEDLSVFLKAEGVFDFQVWDIGQVIVSNFDWLPFTPSGRLLRSFSFQLIFRWKEAVLEIMPDSVIEIDLDVHDGQLYFRRFFCAFDPCLE